MIFWMAYWNTAYVIWRQSTINYLQAMNKVYSQLTLIETTIIWFKWNYLFNLDFLRGYWLDILLIDDHHIFRDGLKLLLQQQESSWAIHAAANAAQARQAINSSIDFDLILLDYNLPDGNGLDLLREIKSIVPATPVALLSAHEDPQLIQATLAAGASGFITKSSSSEVMLSALQLIFSGGVYVPPAILAQNFSSQPTSQTENLSQPVEKESSEYHLTERQLEVLQEMVKGLANKEIARELNMSPSTVKAHIAAILREFDVNNRTQAVTLAQEKGLVQFLVTK